MEHTNPGMPKVNRPTEFQIRRTETECPDVELVAGWLREGDFASAITGSFNADFRVVDVSLGGGER